MVSRLRVDHLARCLGSRCHLQAINNSLLHHKREIRKFLTDFFRSIARLILRAAVFSLKLSQRRGGYSVGFLVGVETQVYPKSSRHVHKLQPSSNSLRRANHLICNKVNKIDSLILSSNNSISCHRKIEDLYQEPSSSSKSMKLHPFQVHTPSSAGKASSLQQATIHVA